MNAPYRARLNREPSAFRKAGVPIASVLIGSMTPLLPIVASMKAIERAHAGCAEGAW